MSFDEPSTASPTMKHGEPMQAVRGLWRLLNPQQRRRFLELQIVCVLMGISTLSGVGAVIPFFTVLADPASIERNSVLRTLNDVVFLGDERTFVVALGIFFGCAVLAANALNLLGSLAIDRYALAVGNALKTRLFADYLHRDYGFHARLNSAALASNVSHEAARISEGILRSVLTATSGLVTVVLIVVPVMILNVSLALILVIGFGAMHAAIYLSARRKLLRNGASDSRNLAERAQVLSEGFDAIKEIAILKSQDFFVGRFGQLCESLAATAASTHAIAWGPKYLIESATIGALIGTALWLGGRDAGLGPWLASLSFIAFAAYRVLPALQQIFAAFVRIRADLPALARIAPDLNHATHRCRARNPEPSDPAWSGRPRRAIELRDVTFRYCPEGPPVLDRVSLSIRAGQIVGIVGRNGSGKTTLVDVMLGLLIPESGRVSIDGVVLDATTRCHWQSTVAYVPQRTFLLDATLAQNIAVGTAREAIDAQRLHRAARLARLDELVSALPRGFDEPIGQQGVRLSGGQRQRVAIARALYRDASLLVLDEATSSLDDVVAAELTDMLLSLRRRQTIVMISHATSLLSICDSVVQLDAATMVANGHQRVSVHDSHRARRVEDARKPC